MISESFCKQTCPGICFFFRERFGHLFWHFWVHFEVNFGFQKWSKTVSQNRPKQGPWREGPRLREHAHWKVKRAVWTPRGELIRGEIYHQTTKLQNHKTTEPQTTGPVTTEQDLIMSRLTTKQDLIKCWLSNLAPRSLVAPQGGRRILFSGNLTVRADFFHKN